MDCAVYSPCGRYLVRLRRSARDSLLLLVTSKSTSTNSAALDAHPGSLADQLPDLAARLDPKMVEEISVSAGVKKDFESFANMIFTALVGKSPSVTFFVENCEEMKRRIRDSVRRASAKALTTTSGMDGAGAVDESTISSTATTGDIDGGMDTNDPLEREFFQQRKFFTLDYHVDFTRAIFPVPLDSFSAGLHDGGSIGADDALSAAFGAKRKSRMGGGDEAAGSSERGLRDDEREALLNQIRHLTAENKKLKRENEALTLLSNDKMREMQSICDDLQRRAISEAEHRKLKRDLAESEKRVASLEQLNHKLRREVAAACAAAAASASPHRYRTPPTAPGSAASPSRLRVGASPREPLQPRLGGSASNGGGSARRQQRFQGRYDTPPQSRDGIAARSSSNGRRGPGSSNSSRASTPPRNPRPAWNQRVGPSSSSMASSQPREVFGRREEPQTRGKQFSTSLLSDDSGAGEDQPYRRHVTHERLYKTDTAASSGARRTRDATRLLYS